MSSKRISESKLESLDWTHHWFAERMVFVLRYWLSVHGKYSDATEEAAEGRNLTKESWTRCDDTSRWQTFHSHASDVHCTSYEQFSNVSIALQHCYKCGIVCSNGSVYKTTYSVRRTACKHSFVHNTLGIEPWAHKFTMVTWDLQSHCRLALAALRSSAVTWALMMSTYALRGIVVSDPVHLAF